MDTKSKSIKPAVAFTAFVLGISLLIYTAAAVVILAVAGAGSAVIPWKDVFWTDYQTTDSFRSYLSDRLSVLVRSAADPEGADPMTPEDTNLLYVVTAGDAVRFANTDELRPNQLPEGYNFLLTYDGESVRVYKDGREISDSFQVALPAKTDADVSVSLAAAEHPTEYLSGDYDSFSYLLDDLRQIRAFVIWLLIVPALAGIALTAWSIVWHRYKLRADQAIAWFTGRVWLEIKLLLLIPFLWMCALAFMCLLAVVTNRSPTVSCAMRRCPWPCGGSISTSTTSGTTSGISRLGACAPDWPGCSGGSCCATPPPSARNGG